MKIRVWTKKNVTRRALLSASCGKPREVIIPKGTQGTTSELNESIAYVRFPKYDGAWWVPVDYLSLKEVKP